jgi:hypothetical protein
LLGRVQWLLLRCESRRTRAGPQQPQLNSRMRRPAPPLAGSVIAPAMSVHPDDVARVEAYMREMRTRGGSGGGECAPIRFRRKRADGSYMDVESTGSCDVRCAPRAPATAAQLQSNDADVCAPSVARCGRGRTYTAFCAT